jgi:hypothetical protein
MTERFLVKFQDGREGCYKTLEFARDAANSHDEIIHMTECPEVYHYTKVITTLTNHIGGLMAEVDHLRIKSGVGPKYGTVETV